MAVNIIKRTWHQNQMVKIEPLNGFAFQAESGGHTFEISGIDDSGNVVPISGTIAGVFLRPDNTDVALTGSASGGVASVTLKAECYAVPGRFLLTVYATSGSNKGTIYAAMGTVSRTSSGAVSPAAASDVVDLVNRINAATATIPASYTALLNAVATDYSPDVTYPKVGTFVWYSGKLYRSKVPITTAETWTAAHWNQVVLSDALNQDITLLKSAFDDLSDAINYRIEENPVSFTTAQGEAYGNVGDTIAFNSVLNFKRTSFVPESGFSYKVSFYNLSGMSQNLFYIREVDSNDIVLAKHGEVNKTQDVQNNEVIIQPLAQTAKVWIEGKNGSSYPFTIYKLVATSDVDTLKDSVEELEDSVDTLYEVYDVRKDVDIAWAQGAIGSSGGSASSSTTRIRTYYYANTGLIYKVSVPAAYRVAAFLYNSTTETGYVGCWNGTTPVVGTLTWLTEIRLDAISASYIRFVVSKANSGTIDVDESDVCAFYARTIDDTYDALSNVSEVIGATGNLIEKLLAGATVDSTTGGLVYNSSYSVTNLIKLPQWKTNQRYNPYTTLYAMSHDGTSYGTKYEKVVFYGSNKSVIDVITSGDLTIPSGAVYVRVVFPASNTYRYVGCGILEELPPYQPFHHVVSNEYIPSIAGTIRNSDGAKTNLVKTALQYLGNTDFGYGNTHTAYSESAEAVESDGVTQADGTQTSKVCYEGTKFQIDCSGFTRLTMQCIYPEYTRHYGAANIVPPWGYRYDENAEYDTPYGRLTAHKQALYAYQRGFMYPLADDYSNADVGDMIFVANSASMWGNIGHARIITNVIPLKTGGKQITVMESNSDVFPPIHASKSTQRAMAQYKAARFPLPYAAGDTDAIGTAQSATVQTSGADGTIAEIHLNEATQNKEIYTIVFKADFGTGGNYAIVTGLGNSISFENVLVYNGLHVYTVVFPVDGTPGGDTVTIKAHGEDTVTFGGAKVFKGFHTPTMSDL